MPGARSLDACGENSNHAFPPSFLVVRSTVGSCTASTASLRRTRGQSTVGAVTAFQLCGEKRGKAGLARTASRSARSVRFQLGRFVRKAIIRVHVSAELYDHILETTKRNSSESLLQPLSGRRLMPVQTEKCGKTHEIKR